MGRALHSPYPLPAKATALVTGVSSGKNPACDPRRFYRVFRDNWPEFLRHNFRNATMPEQSREFLAGAA